MSNNQQFDVVVIGGGVIGFSIALRLAQRKVRIAVVDNALPGQATHAAAGMLSPLSDTSKPGPLLDLGLASLTKYADFAAQVADLAGAPLSMEGAGILRVARTDEETTHLKGIFRRRAHLTLPLELLEGASIRDAEPLLTPDVQLAILSPAERHLQPRLLLAALEKATKRLGVELYSGEPVTELEYEGANVQRVHTNARVISCGQVVICGGAWSSAIAQLLPQTVLPVMPVKGQIASLDAAGSSPLHHVILAGDRYLVPRENGEIVFGATEEPEAGFDPEAHPYAISRLRLDAEALVPALSGLALRSAWSGLRPASPDSLPILGRLPRWKNAYAACGHGRNGVLLAPHTADLIASCVLDGKNPPAAFAPKRFEHAA